MVDLTAPLSVGQGMGASFAGNPKALTQAEYEASKAIRAAGVTTNPNTIPDMSSYWSVDDWASLNQNTKGVQIFPGHSQWNTILNYNDTTSIYDECWRRDLTCAFAWWFVDNYFDPQYLSKNGQNILVAFKMKPGSHSLTFRSGETYTFETGIHWGYIPSSASVSYLMAYWISKVESLTVGSTPVIDNTSTSAPVTNQILLYPHMVPYVVSDYFDVHLNNARIRRSSRNLSTPIRSSFYATVAPGNGVLTNATRADEFIATYNNNNTLTNVRSYPNYPGAPDFPKTEWIGNKLIIVPLAVKGLNDGSNNGVAMPMPPSGGFITGDNLPPVVHSINNTTNTVTLTTQTDWNDGQKLSGASGSTYPAVIAPGGKYANTGTNAEVSNNLVAVMRPDLDLALNPNGSIVGQKYVMQFYVPVGSDASATSASVTISSTNNSAHTITLSKGIGANTLADPSHGTFTDERTWKYQDLNSDNKPDYPVTFYGAQDYRRFSTQIARSYPRKNVVTNGNGSIMTFKSLGVDPGLYGRASNDSTFEDPGLVGKAGSNPVFVPMGEGICKNITVHDGIIDGLNAIIDGDYSDNAYNDKQFQYNVFGAGAWNITFRNVQSLYAESDHFSFWPSNIQGATIWDLNNTNWLLDNVDMDYSGRHAFVLHSIVGLLFKDSSINHTKHWIIDNEFVNGRMIDVTFSNIELFTGGLGFISGSPILQTLDWPTVYFGCTLTPNNKIITTSDTNAAYLRARGECVTAPILGPSQYFSPGTRIVKCISTNQFELNQAPLVNTTINNVNVDVGYASSIANIRFENMHFLNGSPRMRGVWNMQFGLVPHFGTWQKNGHVIKVVNEAPQLSWLKKHPEVLAGGQLPSSGNQVVGGIGPANGYASDPTRYISPGTMTYQFISMGRQNGLCVGVINGKDLGLRVGQQFTISAAQDSSFNGTFSISNISISGNATSINWAQAGLTANGGSSTLTTTYSPQPLAADEILIVKYTKASGLATYGTAFPGQPDDNNPNAVGGFGFPDVEVPFSGLYFHNIISDGAYGGGGDTPFCISLSRAWTEVNITDNEWDCNFKTTPDFNIGWVGTGVSKNIVSPTTHAVDPTALPKINQGTALESTNSYIVTGNNWDNAGDDQVFPASSATTLVLTQSGSAVDWSAQSTFTATLTKTSDGSPIQNKTIVFYDSISGVPTSIGSGATDASGVITITKSANGGLARGIHTIQARFLGDISYLASISNTLTHATTGTNVAMTQTTITQNSTGTLVGANVRFTTTSLAGPSGGSGGPFTTPVYSTAAGGVTITLYDIVNDSPVALATAATNNAGVATFDITNLGVGDHLIYAVQEQKRATSQSSSLLFATSSSPTITHSVGGSIQTSQIVLVQDSASTDEAQAVVFTATLTNGTIPIYNQTVGLVIDGNPYASAQTDTNGVVSFTVSDLSIGLHDIVAAYSGSILYTPSTSNTVQHLVDSSLISTTTEATISRLVDYVGNTTILSATVTPDSGSNIPTGSISFFLDGNLIDIVDIDETGLASTTWTFSASGNRTFQAVYSGDPDFATSMSELINFIVRETYFADDVDNTVPVSEKYHPGHL